MNSMKRNLLIVAVVALAATVGSPAVAQDIRLDLRAGGFIGPHESLDAVADTNVIGSSTIRLSTALGALDGLRLFLEYGTDTSGEVDRLGFELRTDYTRHRFMLGGEWGPMLFGFLRPFAGLSAGYALGTLDAQLPTADYEDFSHDIIGDVFLGTEATLPLGRRDTTKWFGSAGVRFGARGQTSAEFDELSTDRSDDDPWRRVDPKLGTLFPNGWYWDIGIGIARKF